MVERRNHWVVISLAFLSCATPGSVKKVWVPADELSCEQDIDCVIRADEFGCCCSCSPCHGGVYPFAISRSANEAWNKQCAEAACTADSCSSPKVPPSDAFYAVC